MEIGASSACFYPLETERSFLHVAELGIRHCEIFFNSPSELSKCFINELERIKKAYGIDVTSLHPYRSFSEGYDLFSAYKRRYTDAIEKYKRYFDAASILGANYIVLHGSGHGFDIPQEEYAERFLYLQSIARSFGCNIAHENVVHFVCEKTEFASYLASQIGDDFKMVLDVKQARRAGVDPLEFVDAVGKHIVHVHLSDYIGKNDCVPPCEEGSFDFYNLFKSLHKIGYNGKYIIELYSNGFAKRGEIVSSAKYLQQILDSVRQGL